jgi:hypothetical protein
MLWIDRVPSVFHHAKNTTARTTAYRDADAVYGTCNPTWRTSAAIVPNTPTAATASQ